MYEEINHATNKVMKMKQFMSVKFIIHRSRFTSEIESIYDIYTHFKILYKCN